MGNFSIYHFVSITKFTKRLTITKSAKYHENAMMYAYEFLKLFENPRQRVENQLSDRKLQNIERNRHIINSVAEAILFCGFQCIALKHDNEKIAQKGNPGNFFSALLMIDNHDKILNEPLSGIGISHENAKYTSAAIQQDNRHNRLRYNPKGYC